MLIPTKFLLTLKNPRSGRIEADCLGDVVLDGNIKMPADCLLIERNKK